MTAMEASFICDFLIISDMFIVVCWDKEFCDEPEMKDADISNYQIFFFCQ